MAAKLVWVNTGKKVGECDQSGNFIVRDAPRELELWDDKGKICGFKDIRDISELDGLFSELEELDSMSIEIIEKDNRIEELEDEIKRLEDEIEELKD